MTLLQSHSDTREAQNISVGIKKAVTQQFAREKTVLAPEFGYAERGYQVNPTTATAGGSIVPANASAAEAFQLAGADFEVEKQPVWSGPRDNLYLNEDKRAIHRTDTGESLGVVGAGYVPAQNSSLLRLFDYRREDATIDNPTAA